MADVASVGMTLLEALVTVLLAIVGPGGIIILVITVRMRIRADELAQSVGPATDDGSIQDQLQSISTTMRIIAANSDHAVARIGTLEVGYADHSTRITAHEERIGALEYWQRQFGVDGDDRLNPPTKEAS